MINLQQDAEGFIRMNRHFPGQRPDLHHLCRRHRGAGVRPAAQQGLRRRPGRVPGAEPPGREGLLAVAEKEDKPRKQDRLRAGPSRHGRLSRWFTGSTTGPADRACRDRGPAPLVSTGSTSVEGLEDLLGHVLAGLRVLAGDQVAVTHHEAGPVRAGLHGGALLPQRRLHQPRRVLAGAAAQFLGVG